MATISSIANQISYRTARERANKMSGGEYTNKIYLAAIESGDDNLVLAMQEVAPAKGWNLVTTDFANIASTTDTALRLLVANHRTEIRQFRAERDRGTLTAKGAQDLFERISAKNNWTGQLDSIVAKAMTVIDTAKRIESMALSRLTAPVGDTQDQLLAEMRMGKAWDRVKAELKQKTRGDGVAAVPVTALLERIRNTTDPYELAAIVAEGPSWLTSKGEPDASNLITAAVAQVDQVVGNAAASAQAASRFQSALTYDAMVVREIITSTDLTSDDLTNEGYVDLTRTDYTIAG